MGLYTWGEGSSNTGTIFYLVPWVHATMLLLLAENDLALKEHVFQQVNYIFFASPFAENIRPTLELLKHSSVLFLGADLEFETWNLGPNPYIFFLNFFLEHLGALM